MKKEKQERTHKLIEFDNDLRRSFSDCSQGAILCGVDEAGRGPIAGPVVAAAVVFSDDTYIDGIYDSKKLTHRQRDDMFEEIKYSAITYGVGIISSTEIDEVNILEATKMAMNRAVSKLKVNPHLIIADGNFYKNETAEVRNFIRGDAKSFSIAAASIVAKVTRDRIMADFEMKFPHFSFSHHKGYGTAKHIDEILEHGYTEIHRRSFKVKSLQGELF